MKANHKVISACQSNDLLLQGAATIVSGGRKCFAHIKLRNYLGNMSCLILCKMQ